MNYGSNIHSHIIPDLPAQMIPLTKKNEEWKKKTMDVLENIGRIQYQENVKLIENYEMVKGRFIYSHYFETDGYSDFIAQLTKEFELPTYLRHYDIISQVINTLSGEYQKRPDTFRVKNYSEDATNEYQRTKTEMLVKYVQTKIEAEVTRKLIEQGLDPERTDFESQEEMAQYQQVLDQARQALTPPEIQEYMDTQWSQAAEIWGQHQIELDKQRFQLAEKEKKEFEDMLISDRCFRHFYLTPTGYTQETWNPVQVFFQKSPDVDYIEEGDYVGRVFYLTIPAIIDRYGHLMTKKEIEALQDKCNKADDKKWNYSAGSNYVFDQYMTPFKGFQAYDILNKTSEIPFIEPSMLDSMSSGRFFSERKGLFMITEGYWKSQEKIGKVTYIDPETGVTTKKYVDETFLVPKDFTQMDSTFNDSDEPNTVVWTWVNRVWKGIKINLKNSDYGQDLYIDISPVPFQFKGDLNPYAAKLPVCGQVFSIRNSKSMSLVDLMKPYQIFYNVAMNQLYQIMEREIGAFIVMDVNLFPNLKDWGGEKGWEKFMLVAKQLGMAPADTSPNNSGGISNNGGQFPKEINLDESARMVSRLKMAEAFEQMALRQVGFNEARLGTYGSGATATGVQNAATQSYAQTESYFTNFTNYLRRCHEMNLAIAQYVQSQEKDVTVMYTKSDMSRVFIKVLGTDLLLSDLHVRVINSQEFIRQTEALRSLAIQNNTSGASILDLAEIITAHSPSEIKIKLKESVKRQDAMQERQMAIQQEQVENEKNLRLLEIQKEEEMLDKKLDNNLDVAYITQGTDIINNDGSDSESKQADIDMKGKVHSEKLSSDRAKTELQRQKLVAETQFKNKKLGIEQAKINADLQIQKEKLQLVKTLKGKKND